MDLDEIHKKVLSIAEDAAQISMQYFTYIQDEFEIKNNKGKQSIVTKADKEINTFLIRSLGTLIQDSSIIGEEGSKLKDSKYFWVVDPIDGTTNFQKGFNNWGISISLWNKYEPLYGLVFFPLYKDYYMYAIKGKGVFNSRDLAISLTATTGFKNSFSTSTGNLAFMSEVLSSSLIIDCAYRCLGSACAEGYFLSKGAFDFVAMCQLSGWDVGAILLFFSEIGIEVDFIGGKYTPEDKEFAKDKHTLLAYKPDADKTNLEKIRKILKKYAD